jgi:anti-sigma regulatory factor (Ser/Thr protein kinase)
MDARVTPNSLCTELPFTFEAPSTAREQLRWFARNLRAATVDDAVLMVSELVSNAVAHGQPEVTLRLRLRPDRLTVAVADRGEAPLTCATPRLQQASGRGLVIVDALATRWGVSQGRFDKQVWFDLAT